MAAFQHHTDRCIGPIVRAGAVPPEAARGVGTEWRAGEQERRRREEEAAAPPPLGTVGRGLHRRLQFDAIRMRLELQCCCCSYQ